MAMTVNQIADDYFCTAIRECTNKLHQEPERLLQFDEEGDSRGYADDATWILTSSFVIFTMQSGFGLLELGSCGDGYQVNIMMKNIVDVVFGTLAYYLVGYGISFGRPYNSFMGLGNMPAEGGFDLVQSSILYSKYIFQLSFAATSTTIVSGCVAMRLRFSIYIIYSFFAVIFYAFVAHWIFDPNGWLSLMGAHDFAGGAVVHIFGGINGLVAIIFLGPRRGRFDGSRPVTDFFPSSPSSQCLGLFMLWWGWLGFNCGSSFGITDDRWSVAVRAASTTINSTAAGGVVSILYSLWRTQGHLVIAEHIVNGILGALVAITPSCACVHAYDSFPIGAIGAIVALGSNTLVCKLELDDPVGAVGVHAFAGIWGVFSVGLFADAKLSGITVDNGLFRGGGLRLLGVQCLAIVATIAWSIAWSSLFFYVVGINYSNDCKDPRTGLRICPKEEELGADWHLHGIVGSNNTFMQDKPTENAEFQDIEEEQKSLCSPHHMRGIDDLSNTGDALRPTIVKVSRIEDMQLEIEQHSNIDSNGESAKHESRPHRPHHVFARTQLYRGNDLDLDLSQVDEVSNTGSEEVEFHENKTTNSKQRSVNKIESCEKSSQGSSITSSNIGGRRLMFHGRNFSTRRLMLNREETHRNLMIHR